MLSYVIALSVVGFILLALTYVFYSYDFFEEINNSLEGELDLLQSAYQKGGVESLNALVEKRKAVDRYDRFSYILVNQNQQKLSGDLPAWPSYKTWSDGWLSFELSFKNFQGEPQLYNFLARLRLLDNGQQLLVARVSDDVRQNIQLVAGTLLWGLLIMILLGIIGAVITSFISIQRVDTINQTIRNIMLGNLSERIPVQEPYDDFQHLSMNINTMLGRIESAVDDVRQVTNNIAHDLRTPLTRLRNRLSKLQSRTAPENVDTVQAMLQEADGLLSTFNALLRISQIESGAKRENFVELNFSQIVNDVVELYEPLASDKNITIEQNISLNAIVTGDKDLLFQMLLNVLDNAIKYTDEGGYISIQLIHLESTVRFNIADTGVGIPEAQRKKVFQRFYRVEESRGEIPGNGLGLSLVQAVVNLHHGAVYLTAYKPWLSVNPGLKVDVQLPVNPLRNEVKDEFAS